MTYPDDGHTPGNVSQFVIVCVKKTVVVPTPGLGLHVPVFGVPLFPPVGFDVELQGPGTTVGVRAQVWHKHASPPSPGWPPPPPPVVIPLGWIVAIPLLVGRNVVTVDVVLTVIVAPDGKATFYC